MKTLFWLLLTAFTCSGKAQSIAWSKGATAINIGDSVEILEDPTKNLTISQVSNLASEGKFVRSQQKILHFGFTNSAHWLHFFVQNNTSDSLVVALEQAVLPEADMYFKNPDGLWQCYKAGYNVDLNKKIIRSHYQVFPLHAGAGEYYVRLISFLPPVPVKIYTSRAFEAKSTDQKFSYGVYTGILLFVVLLNIFLFFSLAKFTYLQYSSIVFIYWFCSASMLDGYIVYFFPKSNITFLYTISPILAMADVALYAVIFLQVKTYAPSIYKFSLAVVVYYISYIAWHFLLPDRTLLMINQLNALLAVIFVFFIGIITGLHNNRMGYYFSAAYILYFVVLLIEMIYMQTGKPVYLFDVTHASIGALIEALLLSYLLSVRLKWDSRETRRAKEEAQTMLLKKTQENEALALNQNVKLEETVRQRTKEIEYQKEIAERALFEKEILLKEIHHRVKNNLQTISSMLMLQGVELKDGEAKKALLQTQNRVLSIAMVHQKLYQNGNVEKVELKGMINDLEKQIKLLHQGQSINVSVALDIPETNIFIDRAIPLGLILNELFTNSYKYAFNETGSGSISLSLGYLPLNGEHLNGTRKVKFTYSDSGKGIAPDAVINPSRLGLRLVNLLSKQIGAQMSYSNNNGSEFVFLFNIDI